MEVKYDKTAILEYIANFRELQELMRRDMDESLNQYKVCKQEYSRIFTECEEESRRAYNRVLSAESEIQMANMMMEQAMRAGTDSDEGESQIDYDMISRAQEMRMQAEADLVAAKADYTRAQDNISKLNAVMEKYGPALESESKLVNDTFTECSIVGSKAGEALEQYIGVMEKAHAALYEGATPQMSSRGSGSSSAGSSGNGDANGSSGVASSGLGNAQTISGNTSSGAGTQIMGAVASGGFLFSIAGQKKEFENSKAGLNQAYKEAIKANDKSAAAEIKQAFDNFGKSNGNMQSRKVNTEKNLQNTQWSDVEYFNVSDKIRKADQNSNVLKWSGEMGNSLRVPKDKSGELSQSLRDFGVEGIQYVNGDVDFSPVTKYEVEFSDAEKLYEELATTIKFGDLIKGDEMKSRSEFNDIIRTKWQEKAKQQIVDKIATDKNFAKDFSAQTGINPNSIKTVSDLKKELKRNGLSLHETPDCKKIQLVPTLIHDAFKHVGGTAEMLERLINGDIHGKINV